MCPKDIDGVANIVDPDQTAPKEQSDQGLHCLLRPVCLNILTLYSMSYIVILPNI